MQLEKRSKIRSAIQGFYPQSREYYCKLASCSYETGKLNKNYLTECKCFTNGVPILYAVTLFGGSDEVVGLQRKKQASNPILRSFLE